MSGSASLDLERQILQHTLAIAPMPALARVYVALCETAPTEAAGGAELAGGGYARTAATFALIATPANAASNTTAVDFAPATADWRPISHFELWTQQTGGVRLYWGQLVDPVDGVPIEIGVSSGSAVRFSPGSLVVQIAEAEQQGLIRPADIANVIDYGADRTGSTDSTAAFQAALASGKSVWAPSGTYIIRGQLTVSGGQWLRGDGSGTTLLVDVGFDPTVTTGVIVMANPLNHRRPALSDLTIEFAQPPDLTTTATVASAIGATTVTVASADGIVVGMTVLNKTHIQSVQCKVYENGPTSTVVSAIAGNDITLSVAVKNPGVSIGDVLHFASVRSMFRTLADGGTASPGGTGIKYPWAVYIAPSRTALVERVMIIRAWTGIYIRGPAYQVANIDIGAYSVGLDIDEVYNFSTLNDYRFWPWGNDGTYDALNDVGYDNVTIAANLGDAACAANNFGTWRGHVNILPNWLFGSFTNLMLDGDNTNLTITSTRNGWAHINGLYSTKSSWAQGVPFWMHATDARFHCQITNMDFSMAGVGIGVRVQSGIVSIVSGNIWFGSQAVVPMFQVEDFGGLYLSDMRLDASAARTDTYINLLGSAVLRLTTSTFTQSPGVGGTGVSTSPASKFSLSGTAWNGWDMLVNGVSVPPTDTGDSLTLSNGLLVTAGGFQVTGNLGFHGAAKVGQQVVTGSRAGNAALASLLTALANYGLINNSSSA